VATTSKTVGDVKRTTAETRNDANLRKQTVPTAANCGGQIIRWQLHFIASLLYYYRGN